MYLTVLSSMSQKKMEPELWMVKFRFHLCWNILTV